MVEDLIRKLLEAGVHFGHQTHRWNPKMKPYIFGARSGIYIIDLEKTADCLGSAREFIQDLASTGGKILFIGTKKQAQMIIEEEATKADMFFVKHRWLGGLLTNFETVKKSIDRLNKIERMETDGTWENLKKKETVRLVKEKEKLLLTLGGIREMKTLPQAVFIVDPKKEAIAVKEARKLNIPIVAIVDTNCDPELINYPIPGNDDALKSIRFVTALLSENIKAGAAVYKTSKVAQAADDANAKAAATTAKNSKDSKEATTAKAKDVPAKS